MTLAVQAADVERFRAIVARRFGLDFEDGKLEQLADVLRRRQETARGAGGPAACLDRLAAGDRDELRAVAQHLTVGETYFFRYRDHFRALAETVLPERLEATGARRALRILSAGTASGEEAYTLAILAHERLRGAGVPEVQIVGIDLNPQSIAKATRAEYSAWAFRDTPPDVRERYFRKVGGAFELVEEIRARVVFEERNLTDDDPLFWCPEAFDIVFCRNVLMYFTPGAMRDVVRRIGASLRPGGYLFLGHAETLRGVSSDYHLCHTHDAFYYQRRESLGRARESFDVRVADAAPAVFRNGDDSWVEDIRRASERVAALAAPRGPDAPAETLADALPAPGIDHEGLLTLLREERFGDVMSVLHALPAGAKALPEAQLLRAALLTNAGRFPEAAEACRALLEVDELSAGAHYLMALCCEQLGDRQAALDHDQTAAYLEPGFVMPHFHLGLLARRAGHLAQARAELSRAEALLPGEDASRILLFGGGFGREALATLCQSELRLCGAEP
jgi:chemotaxis protein methyltransferase CheR